LLLAVLRFSNIAAAAQAELKDLSIDGGVQDGKARLVIEGHLTGIGRESEKVVYATALQHAIHISREKQTHTIAATFEILQGEPKELTLTISGDGEIKKVTGDALQDWSVREETNGTRSLVLRPRKGDKPLTQIRRDHSRGAGDDLLVESDEDACIRSATRGVVPRYVKIETASELDAQPVNPSGVVPIEPKFLPESLRGEAKTDDSEPLAFRFHGSAYSLPLNIVIADPEARRVVLRDFRLEGQLSDQSAAFTLVATARVKNPRGATLALLSGGVALSEVEPHPDWRLTFTNGQFVVVFDKPGEFPLRLKFNAAVRPSNEWNRVDFRVAPSALQPISFQGLAADTQFEFAGAARPERSGDKFASFLPPDGAVKLAWKPSKTQAEGKLFTPPKCSRKSASAPA
jgi:hypothetical protein